LQWQQLFYRGVPGHHLDQSFFEEWGNQGQSKRNFAFMYFPEQIPEVK
jgi:hypothetical protein